MLSLASVFVVLLLAFLSVNFSLRSVLCPLRQYDRPFVHFTMSGLEIKNAVAYIAVFGCLTFGTTAFVLLFHYPRSTYCTGLTNSSDPQFDSATFIEELKPVSIASYVILCVMSAMVLVAAPIWRPARYTYFYTVSSVLLILVAVSFATQLLVADTIFFHTTEENSMDYACTLIDDFFHRLVAPFAILFLLLSVGTFFYFILYIIPNDDLGAYEAAFIPQMFVNTGNIDRLEDETVVIIKREHPPESTSL